MDDVPITPLKKGSKDGLTKLQELSLNIRTWVFLRTKLKKRSEDGLTKLEQPPKLLYDWYNRDEQAFRNGLTYELQRTDPSIPMCPYLVLIWTNTTGVLCLRVDLEISKRTKYTLTLLKELDPELYYAYTLGLEHERIK